MRRDGHERVDNGRKALQVLLCLFGFRVDRVEDDQARGMRRKTASDQLFAAGDAGALRKRAPSALR